MGQSGRAIPDGLTQAQRTTLGDINDRAVSRDLDGWGFDLVATETATGDPVVYVYDKEDDFVLRPDGSLDG